MATNEIINKLREVEKGYLDIDKNQLLRANLGEESLAAQLTPIFDELQKKYEFTNKYAQLVHDSHLNEVISVFSDLNAQFTNQAQRNNQEYIAQKTVFITTCLQLILRLKLHWPPFIAAAVEERGLLEDEGVLKQYEKTVESLKKESEETIAKIKSEAETTIESARNLAEEIETKARRTAAKISVKAAQDQFSQASKPLGQLVIIWSIICLITISIFFVIISKYLKLEIPDHWTWQVIYFATIRLTALGAVGTIAAFSLKIFKSSLHMYLHNKHRLRLTNSIEAFVESAVTPEQRDLILSQLVEAVASFGNSGLLDKDSSNDIGSRMTIDNITRSFTDAAK